MNRRVWKVIWYLVDLLFSEIWIAVRISIVKCRMDVFESKIWREMVVDLWWLVCIYCI